MDQRVEMMQRLQWMSDSQRETFAQRLTLQEGFSIEESRSFVERARSGELFDKIDTLVRQSHELRDQLRRIEAWKNIHIPPGRPWQRAIEMKVACCETMDIFGYDDKLDDVSRGFSLAQAKMLRAAEPYWWSDDISTAVWLASSGISATTMPEEVVVPGFAGWWWFDQPLGIKVTPDNRGVCALLWSRSERGMEFAAYVLDDTIGAMCAMGWTWQPGVTWEGLIEGISTQQFLMWKPTDIPPEEGHKAIGILSRIFLAGCVWLNQKVAAETKENIERHRRKQFAREHVSVAVEPTIRVIHLRKREAAASTHVADEGAEQREYSCRWVVSGHWRNQFYASNNERKLIYIMPFVKGPADKPFKKPPQTVYQVNR